MSAPNSNFVRACKSQPVERTPVWFMRQAGRYMPEYRAIRKEYSLLEICKNPKLAAQVTIEAAEILKVDAAIIFADLLLPLEVMGLPFHFAAGEGPVIEKPIRTQEDIEKLRTDRASELGYVSEAVSLVAKHFAGKIPVIGFCGAPFTLASYMIEGAGSRHYLHAKKMMYNSPDAWDELMRKLVEVTTEYSAAQVRAGADVIQIFDSWVGALSVEDYRRYVLPHVTTMVKRLQKTGARLIWATTTPVPDAEVKPPRRNADVVAYNAAAAKIMAEAGIPIGTKFGELRPSWIAFTALPTECSLMVRPAGEKLMS